MRRPKDRRELIQSSVLGRHLCQLQALIHGQRQEKAVGLTHLRIRTVFSGVEAA